VCSHKSRRYLWKVFRWRFLSRHRHHFRWPFLSQQGLRALMNPRVTCESGFIDDFWVDSGLVFFYYLWIDMGLWALTNPRITFGIDFRDDFGVDSDSDFLNIYESTVAVCAEESMCHLWKQFRWLFLRRQWLSFHWLFLSQQGLWALTNQWFFILQRLNFLNISKSTRVMFDDESMGHLWKQLRWWVLSRQLLCFHLLFQSQ